MKFLHIADCHLDAPFVELGLAYSKANLRRHELKETFSMAIEMAKENDVDVLLISGDLFEHKYVEKSTIRFINDKFNEISDIRVFIAPGNHDPFIQNSYYNTFEWAPNVHIFTGVFEKVYIPELKTNIWGVGFSDFYVDKCLVRDIDREEKDKINILITHGTLDTVATDDKYHPLVSRYILGIGFDYCALGHIHKPISDEKNAIYYPGSTEPLGFDETGEHGVILGELRDDFKYVKFRHIAKRNYFIQDVNVEGASTAEEVIDRIKLSINFEISKENFYKINLIGRADEDLTIDTAVVEEGLKNYFYYVKVEDNTEIPYDIESFEGEYTLKSIFAKKMEEMIKKAGPEERERLEKALQYGLDALIKGEVKF